MMDKIRTRAGRLFLLAVGLLLTTTVGHAAARMMATQMALGSATFAFQLAIVIAVLLVVAHVAAFHCSRPLQRIAIQHKEPAERT